MKLSTSRHCLSGCDWVRLGVGVAIRKWSWGMMFGFSVGVAGVDQLRCDAMRSDPIRNGVVSVSSTSCLMTMGQRTTDSGTVGHWTIIRSCIHNVDHISTATKRTWWENTMRYTSHKRPRQTLSQPEQSRPLPNHLTSFQDVVVAHVVVVVVAAAAATVLAKVQVRIWASSVEACIPCRHADGVWDVSYYILY